MTKEKKQEPTFEGLGIAPKLLEILGQLKYTTPTPIQLKSIPITIEGKDMVGIAQTGTGKTLAFGVPMLQRLAQHKGTGLVLLPTRELAAQVDENLKMIGDKMGLRTAILIGGAPMNWQLKVLRRNPHIIIATPGRLIDHLRRKSVNLNSIKVLVLDEADLMFDMGFAPQIKEILKTVPKDRQTMLFSATMPPEIMKIAAENMALPVRIEVAPAGTPGENITQEMIVINREDRLPQLEKILKEYVGSVLIFARTKFNVSDLCRDIREMGHSVVDIHSNKSLAQRREALASFSSGRSRILVATDIASRGIDVKNIELVLNYDLPDSSEDYVHRIGRTGRAGKTGMAISFATPSQLRNIRQIEQLIKKSIPLTKLAEIRTERKRSFGYGGGRGRNKFSSRQVRGGDDKTAFTNRAKGFNNSKLIVDRKFDAQYSMGETKKSNDFKGERNKKFSFDSGVTKTRDFSDKKPVGFNKDRGFGKFKKEGGKKFDFSSDFTGKTRDGGKKSSRFGEKSFDKFKKKDNFSSDSFSSSPRKMKDRGDKRNSSFGENKGFDKFKKEGGKKFSFGSDSASKTRDFSDKKPSGFGKSKGFDKSKSKKDDFAQRPYSTKFKSKTKSGPTSEKSFGDRKRTAKPNKGKRY